MAKPPLPPFLSGILSDSTRLDREIARIVGPTFSPDNPFQLSVFSAATKDAEELRKLYSQVLPGQYFEPVRQITVGPQVAELESEVAQLRKDIREKTEVLRSHAADSKNKDKEAASLRGDLLALQEKQSLAHLLNRVCVSAQARLLADEQFRARFQNATPCNAYVLSIDIRRSTDLMLKAREPRLFAEFMITLANSLRQVILENYGVFDKFTGDGILAFFPEFLSGEDAGYLALNAAAQCHAHFAGHYLRSRSSFRSVLLDTGLGIGIDYGSAQIVQIGGEFTVVGEPVVYACRMGGAEAGLTYLNQPAYDQLFHWYAAFDFAETELTIKHEGRVAAYSVRPNGKAFEPKPPDWLNEASEVAPDSVAERRPAEGE